MYVLTCHTSYVIPNIRSIQDVIEGTINIARQAITAGVKRVIVTSSLIALISGEGHYYHVFEESSNEIAPVILADFSTAFGTAPLTENSWNEITEDKVDIQTQPAMAVYVASKTIAERKLWELADQNPSVDFSVGKSPTTALDLFVLNASDFLFHSCPSRHLRPSSA